MQLQSGSALSFTLLLLSARASALRIIPPARLFQGLKTPTPSKEETCTVEVRSNLQSFIAIIFIARSTRSVCKEVAHLALSFVGTVPRPAAMKFQIPVSLSRFRRRWESYVMMCQNVTLGRTLSRAHHTVQHIYTCLARLRASMYIVLPNPKCLRFQNLKTTLLKECITLLFENTSHLWRFGHVAA